MPFVCEVKSWLADQLFLFYHKSFWGANLCFREHWTLNTGGCVVVNTPQFFAFWGAFGSERDPWLNGSTFRNFVKGAAHRSGSPLTKFSGACYLPPKGCVLENMLRLFLIFDRRTYGFLKTRNPVRIFVWRKLLWSRHIRSCRFENLKTYSSPKNQKKTLRNDFWGFQGYSRIRLSQDFDLRYSFTTTVPLSHKTLNQSGRSSQQYSSRSA